MKTVSTNDTGLWRERDKTDIKIFRLQGCAACGMDHGEITFKKLSMPRDFEGKDGVITFTHWAPCPNNGEPILMMLDAPEPLWASPTPEDDCG